MLYATDKSRRKNAIVFCIDATYLPFALHLAAQIHFHEPHREYDFVLLSDADLVIPPSLDYLRVKTYPALKDSAYDKLDASHLPRSTYLRLWAPLILSQDYDRILYLDSDMAAEGGGFGALLRTDLQGNVLAAVRDVQQWYRPERQVAEFKLAGRPLRRYFNAGLMLIDVDQYRREDILGKALDMAQKNPQWVRHHDQSLLNLVLDGNWTELSPIWNWQWPLKYPLFGDWLDIRLNHFIGADKPWNDINGHAPSRYYNSYRCFFAAHFPRYTPPQRREFKVLHDVSHLTWLLLRFVFLRRKLLRFTDKFKSPYMTLK